MHTQPPSVTSVWKAWREGGGGRSQASGCQLTRDGGQVWPEDAGSCAGTAQGRIATPALEDEGSRGHRSFICSTSLCPCRVGGLHSVFTAQVFSISSEQELPCSCCAWVFHSSVFSCCTSQILGHTGSVIVAHWLNLPAASGVFPNQISNAYSKHPADRLLTTGLKGKSFWEGLRNQSLLHETWHYGLFLRRLIECCPLLQATS